MSNDVGAVPVAAGPVPAVLEVELTQLDNGERARLRSDPSGTFLIQRPGEGDVLERRLGAQTHFRLRPSTLTPRLHVAEGCYRLSRTRVDRALRIISRCRLPTAVRQFERRPGLVVPDESMACAVTRRIGSNEGVLGLVPTRHLCKGESPVLGAFEVPAWLLLTERRLERIAVSRAGDVVTEVLPDDALSLAPDDTVRVMGERVQGPHPKDLRLLAKVAQQHGTARLVELARLLSVAVDAPLSKEASRLLGTAAAAGSKEAKALAFWLDDSSAPEEDHVAEPTDSVLDELAELPWDDLGRHWNIPAGRVEQLLHRLPASAPWHGARAKLSRLLADLEMGGLTQPHERAERELRLVERLLAAGAVAPALETLQTIERALPPLTLADVDVPSQLAKTPWFELRKRYLRLTTELSERGGAAEHAAGATLQWVSVQPLDALVLERAARSAPEVNAHKCAVALRLLSQAGALSPLSSSLPKPLQALDAEHVERLHDPLARGHERFWARAQELTAKTIKPDFATLRLYCERVTESGSALANAVDEAATLLGVGHVDVYVSRGHDDVGVRAFSNDSAVLLVGGQHLDAASRYYMPASELRFCVATELAHVRFGHARVAPRDVARGVLDKGRQGLDITLSLLPVVAGLKLADRLGVATAKLSLPKLGRLVHAAKDVTRAVGSRKRTGPRSDLAHQNETLIDAHRFSQLTADRAGLVACSDLASALRAMLLARTDYVRVVSRLQEQDLLTAIEQQHSTSPAAFDDLLLRVGMLVAFYVSDDFDTLARVATTGRAAN